MKRINTQNLLFKVDISRTNQTLISSKTTWWIFTWECKKCIMNHIFWNTFFWTRRKLLTSMHISLMVSPLGNFQELQRLNLIRSTWASKNFEKLRVLNKEEMENIKSCIFASVTILYFCFHLETIEPERFAPGFLGGKIRNQYLLTAILCQNKS